MFTSFLLLSNISSTNIIIALVGYVIVFSALFILYSFFKYLPKLLYYNSRKKTSLPNKAPQAETHMLGEETAAIAMALHLFLNEYHDEESGVLTIKKISKAYSPWSSKIYAVRNQFNRI
jgi:glutaconyl-CoA/methylmalonyl-CoA decarboxylase subunit delta